MKQEYTITAIGLYHDPRAIGRLERLTERTLGKMGRRSFCRGVIFYDLNGTSVRMYRSSKQRKDRMDLVYLVSGDKRLVEQGIEYLRSIYSTVSVEKKTAQPVSAYARSGMW